MGTPNAHELKILSALLGLAPIMSGCGFSPEMLPTFSRYGIAELGGITRSVPIIDVEHAVQCELKEFLESDDKDFSYSYKNRTQESFTDYIGVTKPGTAPNVSSAQIANNLLQFDQPAQITLTVKTDMEGKVTAGGVNFKQLGVGFLANAISVTKTSTSATPSFAAYLQGTGELSAAPVAAIPQTSRDVWQVYFKSKDGSISTRNLQVDDTISDSMKTEAKKYLHLDTDVSEQKLYDDSFKQK